MDEHVKMMQEQGIDCDCIWCEGARHIPFAERSDELKQVIKLMMDLSEEELVFARDVTADIRDQRELALLIFGDKS